MPDISIGVVIVTFNSGSEAVDCAETLSASAHAAQIPLRVALVDNASTDDTIQQLQAWASGEKTYETAVDIPFAVTPVAKPLSVQEGGPDLEASDTGTDLQVAIIQTGGNRGFAGGVNVGLAYLARHKDLQHFWVLNPDGLVPPPTVGALAKGLAANTGYGLMGGRVNYVDPPGLIQADGGLVNWKTGVTRNYNTLQPSATALPPDPAELDFIVGASMVASRAFYETVGPMREDYFLYYEETDWATRRGKFPLAYCAGMDVFHRAGTAIGSPTPNRPASPLSQYFKHRGRMRFIRRFRPASLPFTYLYSLAYTAKLLLLRAWPEAWAVVTGTFGLPPPAGIRKRIGPAGAKWAFAPAKD